MTDLTTPELLEKWRADLSRVLGDELVIELRRRGAGELLTLINALDASGEQYRRDSIDYRDDWRAVSAENGSLQAHLALKREQVQRQQARADAATAALDRVRAVHQPYERGPVCSNPDCLCAEPKIVCSCGRGHADWDTAYPCPTIRAIEGDQ